MSGRKIKTRRAAAKRFKRSGRGRIKRSRAFASHILTKKRRKRKRRLRQPTLVGKQEIKKIKRLLPGL